jgi:hypothetical protein
MTTPPPPRIPGAPGRALVAGVLAVAALSAGGCLIGGGILEVGKPCSRDSDCRDERLECVPAESAAADRVCMPIFSGEGEGEGEAG